jgi:hypothetical protein
MSNIGRRKKERKYWERCTQGTRVVTYGVYDPTRNEGWVSGDIDHDTAYFATASIPRWWGKPLLSREIVIDLISHTTTSAGLAIKAELDEHSYETGLKVTNRD